MRPWAQAASPVPHHSHGDGGERSEYVLPLSIESNPGVNHSREEAKATNPIIQHRVVTEARFLLN